MQAVAVDLDAAVSDAVAGQRVVVQDRRAGGQRQVAGVDEAAAVAGDAGGVGDDDLRPRAGDFEVAAQQARVAGIDFVEDDARAAGRHPGVAGNGSAQLGCALDGGVVEDGAGLLNVELAVDVAADACVARRLDVDERYAVAGIEDGWPLGAWRMGIGDDLRLPRRGMQQGGDGDKAGKAGNVGDME